jgi:hypothetical protein
LRKLIISALTSLSIATLGLTAPAHAGDSKFIKGIGTAVIVGSIIHSKSKHNDAHGDVVVRKKVIAHGRKSRGC